MEKLIICKFQHFKNKNLDLNRLLLTARGIITELDRLDKVDEDNNVPAEESVTHNDIHIPDAVVYLGARSKVSSVQFPT